MAQKHYSIGIIGAGIGGLTAGALLSRQGHKVTIFEKEPIIGGRALSFQPENCKLENYQQLLSRFHMNIYSSNPDLATLFSSDLTKGYTLDLGYHAIGGGVLSNINSVLATLDDHIDTLESNVGFIHEQGYDFPFLSRYEKIKILPKILRLLLASEKTMKKLDSVPMTETIKKYGKGSMKLILEIFSRSITTVNNLDRISTGEMFRSQKNLIKGSKPVGYPKKGLSTINNKLATAIQKNGGEIKTNTQVDQIIFQNQKAIALQANNQTYPFDIIVSNILVQELPCLIKRDVFPQHYLSSLQKLTGTASLCAYHSLKKIDEKLLGKTFHFIERNIGVDGNDAVGMIDFMAASPESQLSPPNQYLIQSYIICTPEETKNTQTLALLKRLLEKNINHLIPNYQDHLNWELFPVVAHLDGVAKTIDNQKPEIQTPIPNFYLIGDCVKAPGIGINCAVNSAKILSKLIASQSQ
ncbi:MAG: NAD(P)-binding protein [Candidatus Thermoplasmatota archaeon]